VRKAVPVAAELAAMPVSAWSARRTAPTTSSASCARWARASSTTGHRHREAEQQKELGRAPDIVASAPFFDTDIYDLAGLLRLGSGSGAERLCLTPMGGAPDRRSQWRPAADDVFVELRDRCRPGRCGGACPCGALGASTWP